MFDTTLKDFRAFSEAIELSQAKRYVDLYAKKGQDKELVEWAMEKLSAYEGMEKSRNGHRLYYKVSLPEISASDISGDFHWALDTLFDMGYSDPDLFLGQITDKYKRRVSIQTALKGLGVMGKRARADFDGSPFRPSLKGGREDVALVFTAHPYDKAGASWNRKWTSCIDPKNTLYGEHGYKLDKLVEGSNVMVYFAYASDRNLARPMGRATLSMYELKKDGGEQVVGTALWPDDSVYGVFPRGLLEVLKKIMGEVFFSEVSVFRADPLYSSDYETKLRLGELMDVHRFSVSEPLDLSSVDGTLAKYLGKKYGGSVEDGVFMVGPGNRFVFPYGKETYRGSELPFPVYLHHAYFELRGTDISSLAKVTGGSVQYFVLKGTNKLTGLSDIGRIDRVARAVIENTAALEDLGPLWDGSIPLSYLELIDTPRLDHRGAGNLSCLAGIRFVQRGAYVCSPFGFDAPGLWNMELSVPDLEGAVENFAKGAHIKEAYPLLEHLLLGGASLTWVPEYLLPTEDFVVYMTNTSPLGKLYRTIYPDGIATRTNMSRFLASRAVTKHAIYWDKLPKELDGRSIGKPKGGSFMGKKIITGK